MKLIVFDYWHWLTFQFVSCSRRLLFLAPSRRQRSTLQNLGATVNERLAWPYSECLTYCFSEILFFLNFVKLNPTKTFGGMTNTLFLFYFRPISETPFTLGYLALLTLIVTEGLWREQPVSQGLSEVRATK